MGFRRGQQSSQPATTASGFDRKATRNPQLHIVPSVSIYYRTCANLCVIIKIQVDIMRIIILLFALSISILTYGIPNKDKNDSIEIANIKTVNTESESNSNLTDRADKIYHRSFIEFALPSLIALIVGLMPFIATLIASNKQKIVAEKQINASKETIKEQIDSSFKIAEMDFRKNVLSDNRQKWINELRNVISEFISIYDSHIFKPGAITTKEYERLLFLITKTEFMLNPGKDMDYINSITDLRDSIILLIKEEITKEEVKSLIEIVKSQTKLTLKTEWERVKKGE